MADQQQAITWVEETLFDGGYDTLSVELTIHLDAREDLILTGVSIYDTATREPLGTMAFISAHRLTDTSACAVEIQRILDEVRSKLEPFP